MTQSDKGQFVHLTEPSGEQGNRMETAETALKKIGLRAKELMQIKGSYDCPKPDHRIDVEYQRAYRFIGDLADDYGPKDGRTIEGESECQKSLPSYLKQITKEI